MSTTVTLVSDRTEFNERWKSALANDGLETRVCASDQLASAARNGGAVVIDVAGGFADDQDELLARVGFVRACGATPVVHLSADTVPHEDVIEEMCEGLVARSFKDVDRLAASLPRRLDAGRTERFEFVTVAPFGQDILAVMGSGSAVFLQRPVNSSDDGSEVTNIRLTDDAKVAVLELKSGETCRIHTSSINETQSALEDGDLALDGSKLGARLKELRLAAGLTQAELARRTGIHRPNIARVEAGRHTPSLETLSRIANAIGVPTTRVLAR